MTIAFVLEQTTLAGGHKNVLTLANFLAESHNAEVWCIGPAQVGWFTGGVRARVVTHRDYTELAQHLESFDGDVIGTWWKTAEAIARVRPGFHFVQDFETVYCSQRWEKEAIWNLYQDPNLVRFTESQWVAKKFHEEGFEPISYIGQGVDHAIFYPTRPRFHGTVIFHVRDHFLKGPELREKTLALLAHHVHRVGFSPWNASPNSDEHIRPDDWELADRMRNSLCLLVTSLHEGFCLPALEAMACGIPVVTTACDGNTFCVDGYNSLIGETAHELADHVLRIRQDSDLRKTLREGAIATAKRFRWENVVGRLKAVLEGRTVDVHTSGYEDVRVGDVL